MFLKIVMFAVAAMLMAILARKVMEQVAASKARAKVYARRNTQGMTRLRRDPATGIYHPEA